MKTMIIGLSPEYNYPGSFEEWKSNNTYYASNHGASFICQALLRQFDADYIDDFSDIPVLRNKYDVCVLALSTHIHRKRDISYLADVVEKLDMKTIALSLGMEDYIAAANDIVELHPSVIRLLHLVSERSEAIGVRGPHTASILQKHGFNNIIPVGCPSLQWQLKDNIRIHKNKSMTKPLNVYHRTMSSYALEAMKSATILGQDFLDEVIFTNNRNNDDSLHRHEMSQYLELHDYKTVLAIINRNGIFPNRYELWYDIIGAHDFVIGPRLHGCIAALSQGVPAVLVPRDLRVKEVADFYNIPTASIEDMRKKSIRQIFDEADFSIFKKTHKKRYKNYYAFLEKNKLVHKLNSPTLYDDDSFEVSLKEGSLKEVSLTEGSLKEFSLKLTFNIS
jgi:hypothetical protein